MVFLWNFALGIGAQPAKIDTLAHARCLTAVHARSLLFCFSLVSHHPRQARQIKAKEAEIIGLWNGLKVSFNSVFCFNKDERE